MILTGQILGVFGLVGLLQNLIANVDFYKANIGHIKFYIVREIDKPYKQIITNDIVNTNPEEIPTVQYKDYQLKMHGYVNEIRNQLGKGKLKLNKGLCRLAESYVNYMYYNHIFSHVDLEGNHVDGRARNAGLLFKQYGENLAKINGDWQNLTDYNKFIVESWKQSSSHRNNMLDPKWKYVGYGYKEGIAVQIFAY